MPTFEIVSLEEALKATKTTRWLDEKFGVELEELDPPEYFIYSLLGESD